MNEAAGRVLRRTAMVAGALVLGTAGWLLVAHAPDAAPDPAASYARAFGGSFTLADPNGRPFGSERLRGKPFVIFFGFTRCPDVCPTMLSRMALLRSRLGNDGNKFNIVFVSVDPKGDTPEQIRHYLTLFETPIIGLTGTAQQLRAAEEAFAISAERVPLQRGAYTMDHTASVFLMGAKGEFVSTIDFHENDETALAKLRRLVNG